MLSAFVIILILGFIFYYPTHVAKIERQMQQMSEDSLAIIEMVIANPDKAEIIKEAYLKTLKRYKKEDK
jgi:hypothetical protein